MIAADDGASVRASPWLINHAIHTTTSMSMRMLPIMAATTMTPRMITITATATATVTATIMTIRSTCIPRRS